MGTTSSWKTDLLCVFKSTGDTWEDIESSTLTLEELNREFFHGYGGTSGSAFTIWTKNYVYFPVCYDGMEWIGYVSRNPDGKPTEHQGGG